MRLARAYLGVFRGEATARTGPHALPLARIKKIMKRLAGDGSGGDGAGAWMISGEAPVVFSRACELFVAELTRASWAATLEGRRRTVHAEDVDLFDILADVVGARAGDDGGVGVDTEGGEEGRLVPASGVHGGALD